jgi:hypothetical protein
MISATPGRKQASALPSNQRSKKSLIYAAFAISSNAQITPDRTLVMSRKAVRVRSSALFLTCKSGKNEKPLMFASEALSAVVSPKEILASTV